MRQTENGIDLPYIPDDLLTELESRFPDKCPNINDPDRMIWFKAGQRSVIAVLADQSRRQKETFQDTTLRPEDLFMRSIV